MSYALGYRCTLCQKEYDAELDLYTCPECGTRGILDIIYDYKKMKRRVTVRSLAANKNYSLWRYAPLMMVPEEDLHRTLRRDGARPHGDDEPVVGARSHGPARLPPRVPDRGPPEAWCAAGRRRPDPLG